jgi:hypothetical protein
VNIVGIQPRGEQSDFWKKHFAGFMKTIIPTVIDTSVQPSYSDITRVHGHHDNDSDITSRTATETATQQTRPRTIPSPGSQGSPTQQAGLASPPSEGAMSGLANMKHKLAEIDKERDKFINSQQKIKDDVSEMTDSCTKMSGDMVKLQKKLSDLSESVGRQMKELKEMMSSFINSRLIPTRGSLLIPQVRLVHKYPISPWEMIHPPGGDNPVCM